MDEKLYKRICLGCIGDRNMEFAVENEENNGSIVHGYFKNWDIAKKYGFGKNVTTKNFKLAIYDGYTNEEVENGEVDYYEYDTWEDFYDEFVAKRMFEDLQFALNEFYENDEDSPKFYVNGSDLIKLKESLENELKYREKEFEVCAVSKRDLLEMDVLRENLDLLEEFIDYTEV